MFNKIDSISRDLAFEIVLGGFRFDMDDLHNQLEGIPRAELDKFRARTLQHSTDFVPAGSWQRHHDFVVSQILEWTSGVATAEQLGRKPTGKSWFEGARMESDKGKYFIFSDNGDLRLKRCDKITREYMWGPNCDKSVIKEFTLKEAAEYMADRLLEGKEKGHFISPSNLLPEGSLVGLAKDERKGNCFVFDDGRKISVSTCVNLYGDDVMEILNYEMDERLYFEVRDRDIHSQSFSDFKLKADKLIDKYGTRVVSDFYFDQVLLRSNDKRTDFLRRSVDDLSTDHFYYLYSKTDNGSVMSLINERYSTKELSDLMQLIDLTLSREAAMNEVSPAVDGRIEFKDGPEVLIPEYDDADQQVKMKVNSLFLDYDGTAMVEGVYESFGASHRGVYSLSLLSDKAVKSITEAADAATKRVLAMEPQNGKVVENTQSPSQQRGKAKGVKQIN